MGSIFLKTKSQADMREMEKVIIIFLILAVALSSRWKTCDSLNNQYPITKQQNCSTDGMCPTWFTCKPDGSCKCENSSNDAIVCDNAKQISAFLDCHCVTYDKKSNSTYVGACFFTCEHFRDASKNEPAVYHSLPRTPKMLVNKSICSYFHRTGILCGDCQDGYSPFVLSYNLSCVKCPDDRRNWWRFIMVGFGPLTIFYFIVILLNINATSSRLRGVVWFSQMVSIPSFVRVVYASLSIGNYPLQFKIVQVLVAFYSFWNLDVLRSVIPDTCLSVSTVQALALEYLVALYPFVLIAISYIIIGLYN